jgi:hypothetical protein
MKQRMRNGRARRRGALLMEVLISIAIFTMSGLVILGISMRIRDRLVDTQRQQQAVDLARSVVSHLEAGLATVRNVDEVVMDELGLDPETSLEPPPWQVEIETEPSSFTGLTVVTVIVRESIEQSLGAGGLPTTSAGDVGPEAYRLVQLLDLGEAEEPDEFEVDPLDEEEV